MCELMGMSFAKPVVASVSIQAFSERSRDNADGWGLAWYPDRSAAVVKQPVRWSMQHTQFLEHYPGLLSSIYIAHVRQKTTGLAPTHADTHPFTRELNGREYVFAHNGTLLGDFWERPLGRFRPLGRTDSEFLFCLVLAELESYAVLAAEVEEIHQTHVHTETPTAADADHVKQWKWMHQFLLRLNAYGKLNCILTDGEQMVVYHDKNGWKGLTYRNIFLHEDTTRHFGDATVAVKLEAAPVNHGIIVATNPLSVEGWERFLPGEMKVLQAGNIAFTSKPMLHETNGKAPVESATTMPTAAEAKQMRAKEAAGTKS